MGFTFIQKNHEIVKEMAKMIKHNSSKEYTIVDDLFALSIVDEQELFIDCLLFCNDIEYQPQTKELLEKLQKKAHTCFGISEKCYSAITLKKNTVGIIAKVKINNYTLEDLDNDLLIICDHIELPGNLGTIIRTAEACGFSVINLDGYTKLSNPQLIHSSRGMNLLIKTLEAGYHQTQTFLEQKGYHVFLGEPIEGVSYEKVKFPPKTAIVVGSERYGINPDWYNHSHEKIFIPMTGKMTSLNVGVAASILMYQAFITK